MAEIKSTLELVMERTRHLKLTEEEKLEQAMAEFRKGLSGLIQRCRDGALTADRFREDLHQLQANMQVTDRDIPLDEITKRLELDGDNEWAFNLLAEAFGIDPSGSTAVYEEYREAVAGAALDRADEIRKELGEKQGVFGTAVVPNLKADREWAMTQQRLRERFEPILANELANLRRALNS
jgi:hypothetical protein